MEEFRQKVGERLSVPGGEATVELTIYANATTPATEKSVALSYRDDVCAHLTLTAGHCPTDRDQVMLSGRIADLLGVRLAGLLHPAAPAAPTVQDGPFSADASLVSLPSASVRLTVSVVSPDGAWRDLALGPLVAGRHPAPRSGHRLQ